MVHTSDASSTITDGGGQGFANCRHDGLHAGRECGECARYACLAGDPVRLMDAEAMDTEPDSELAANAMVKDVDDDDILYNIDIAFPTWLWQAMLILIFVSVHHHTLFSLQRR